MKRLICWLRGHKLIRYCPWMKDSPDWLYMCERCGELRIGAVKSKDLTAEQFIEAKRNLEEANR